MNDLPPDDTPAPGARTLRDVARLAGVSVGTASKAMNAGGRLSAETRAKVLSAAKTLDYRPNDLAQSLHRARSMTVGILSTDSFGRFTFPIVEALERRLFDHGIAVFMCNATDDPARERRHIEQLLGERVDGLIVTARRAGGTRVGSATPTRRRSRMRRVATIQLDWLLITSSCQACLPAGSPCLATVYTPSRQISACRPWAFWPLCCP